MKSKAKRILAFVCAIVLSVSSIMVWNSTTQAEAAENFSPVYLSGFKHVTTSNFYNAAGVQMADNVTADADAGPEEIVVPYTTLKDSDGTVLTSHDKTLLSLKVDFEENTAFMTNVNLMVAASQNWMGLLVRPQNNNELRIQTYGGVQTSPTVYFLTTDKVTFMADEFILQLSFEYGDFDNDGTADDVKLGVYINGATGVAVLDGNTADGEITSDNHLMFYNCDMTKLGTQMVLNTLDRATYNTGDITVSKVGAEAAEEPELVVLDGFEHVTTSNYYDVAGVQMADSITADADAGSEEIVVPYTTLKDSDGTVLTSHDKTLLSLKVDFEENTAFMTNVNLMVAASQNWVGLLVRPQNNNELRIQTYGGVQTSPTVYFLTTDKVTSMADEFILQLSFEYGDFDNDGTADDVKLGVYINGATGAAVLDGNTVDGEITSDNYLMFYNCDMTKLGTQMVLNTLNRATYNTGDVTVSKVELPVEEPEPEQPTVVELSGFTSVTTGNFFNAQDEQMEESVTVDADADVAGVGTTQFAYLTLKNSEGEVLPSHDKTLLSVKIDFEKSNYTSSTRWEMAGAGDDKGFRVRTQNDTTLRLETIGGVQTGASIFMLQTEKIASLAEEFNLQLSFEYGDFDNDNNGTADDVKVGVYINGALCTGNVEVEGAGAMFADNHCIFYNCDMTKLGTYMKVYTERESEDSTAGDLTVSAIPGIATPEEGTEPGPEQPTVVELPGFTSVTTGNFFNAQGEQMAESVTVDADANTAGDGTTKFPYPTLKDSEGTVISSHDKTLLSVKIDFEKSNYTSSTRWEMAGAGDDKGFRVRTQNDTTLRLETIGGVQTGASIFMLQTEKIASLAEEFNLQLSFEYGDFDNDNNGRADDVKVGVYINGALCTGNVEVEGAGATFADNHCIFYNCDMTKLGTYMKVYTEREADDPTAGDLTVSAIPGIATPDSEPGTEPGPEPEPVLPNPDFNWITFDQFGVTDKNYGYDISGKVEGTLDKTVFDGDIKIPESILNVPGSQIDMRIGGLDSEQGFRLAIYGGHINLWWVDRTTGQELLVEAITPSALGIDSWVGRFINLKISTEKVGNDIKLGIWFDDVLYQSEYILVKNHAKDLGGNLGIFHSYEGSSIDIKSNPDLVEVIQDEMKLVKPNKDFKWLTFSHFGIQDGNYQFDDEGNQGAAGRTKYTMDKAVFSGDILLPKELSSKADIRIGGVDSWYGLMLVVEKSGNINFKWYDKDENKLLVESISPEKLGLEDWRGRWLNLKISTEIVAADKDGVANDIKVGLWFDDVPCGTKYMIVHDKAEQLGSYMGLLVWEKGMTVALRSIPELIEAFDYEAYGLTKDWEEILLNTGLTSDVVVGKSNNPAPYVGDSALIVLPFVMMAVSVVGIVWYIIGGYNERKK